MYPAYTLPTMGDAVVNSAPVVIYDFRAGQNSVSICGGSSNTITGGAPPPARINGLDMLESLIKSERRTFTVLVNRVILETGVDAATMDSNYGKVCENRGFGLALTRLAVRAAEVLAIDPAAGRLLPPPSRLPADAGTVSLEEFHMDSLRRDMEIVRGMLASGGMPEDVVPSAMVAVAMGNLIKGIALG